MEARNNLQQASKDSELALRPTDVVLIAFKSISRPSARSLRENSCNEGANDLSWRSVMCNNSSSSDAL